MAASYIGEVRDGVVIFPNGRPPEGTKVRVIELAPEPKDAPPEPGGEAVATTDRADPAEPGGAADPIASLRELLLRFAAEAEAIDVDLPHDMAENHNFYTHGKPRS